MQKQTVQFYQAQQQLSEQKLRDKVEVGFSFDDLHILAADDASVYVRGEIREYAEGGKFSPCILIIPRTVFHQAVDIWLKDKQGYYEHWKEFCGVSGFMRSTEYKERSNKWKLRNPKTDRLKAARAFDVSGFWGFTDMEHR